MPTATRPTAPHLKLRSTQPRGVAIAGMATAVALVIVVLLGLVVLTASPDPKLSDQEETP